MKLFLFFISKKKKKKIEMKENDKMFLQYINIDSKCLSIDV